MRKKARKKTGRKLNPDASKTQGKAKNEDLKQDQDDIRRAVDDGMQDLRIIKPR